MKIRVASYNLAHCEDQVGERSANGALPVHCEPIADFIAKYDVDICGMQEMDINCARSGGVDEPAVISGMLYDKTGTPYYYAFGASLDDRGRRFDKTKPTYYGNGIVSKYPILETATYKLHKFPVIDPKDQIKDHYEQRAALFAKIDVNGEPLTFVVTHFDLHTEMQHEMVKLVGEKLKGVDTPVVFMGDFNAGPESDVIAGIDYLEATGDGKTPATFPSWAPRGKIDYIFRSADLKDNGVTVPLEQNHSDHLPIFTDLETV